jgi:GTPase SAR1 family protein
MTHVAPPREGSEVGPAQQSALLNPSMQHASPMSSIDVLKGIERSYKIIMLGSSSTGKTSLLTRFVEDSYTGETMNTIGVDLKSVTL